MTVGVTLMVAVIGAVVVLIALKLGMLPVPLAAKPMLTLEFVHEKLPPAGVLTRML